MAISGKRSILFLGTVMAMMVTPLFGQSAPRPADQVLYDRGIENIAHGDYAGARLALNTLIDRYATSGYQAKAKLAIALSWLRQGDASSLEQAEAEYKDFILFYPEMKAEADSQVGEPLRKIREQQKAKPR